MPVFMESYSSTPDNINLRFHSITVRHVRETSRRIPVCRCFRPAI